MSMWTISRGDFKNGVAIRLSGLSLNWDSTIWREEASFPEPKSSVLRRNFSEVYRFPEDVQNLAVEGTEVYRSQRCSPYGESH